MSTSRVGSGGFKKKNQYNQKDGDVVFRIFPPYKEILETYPDLNLPAVDAWSTYWSVHFGYKNSEGKFRPFESPLQVEWKDKVKTVKVQDPALNRLEDLKAKWAKAIEDKNEPLAARYKGLVGMMGVYNIDKNHHMNVIDLQGNIGTLRIRHKAKAHLEAEIKKLEAEGVDPLSLDNGRFFVFTRIGSGNETSFKVSVYTEKVDAIVNGNTIKVDNPVVHKLTKEVLARLPKEGENLNLLFKTPTAEEVAQIVNEADIMTGKSPACDRIFDARWKAEREAKAAAAPTQTAPATQATPQATTAATLPPVTAAAVQTPVVAAVTLPPITSTTTTNTTASAPATQTRTTQAQAIDELSDDDFIKEMERLG